MKQQNIEEMANVSRTAEAENNNGESIDNISYGKFKDLSTLLHAYNSLEAEFTRRSQKLKEYEGEIARLRNNEAEQSGQAHDGNDFFERFPDLLEYAQNITALTDADSSTDKERIFIDYLLDRAFQAENKLSDRHFLLESIDNMPDVKEIVIQNYLKNIYGSKPLISLMGNDGKVISAPPYKPKNLEEASMLARNLINKKKEIN